LLRISSSAMVGQAVYLDDLQVRWNASKKLGYGESAPQGYATVRTQPPVAWSEGVLRRKLAWKGPEKRLKPNADRALKMDSKGVALPLCGDRSPATPCNPKRRPWPEPIVIPTKPMVSPTNGKSSWPLLRPLVDFAVILVLLTVGTWFSYWYTRGNPNASGLTEAFAHSKHTPETIEGSSGPLCQLPMACNAIITETHQEGAAAMLARQGHKV